MSDYWDNVKHWLGLDEHKTKSKKSLVYLPGVGNVEDIWNDYGALSKAYSMYSGLPYFPDKINARMKELEAAENERYWSDYEKNTGMRRSNNLYPIRSGYYSYSGASAGTFDVNYAIMQLYNGSLRGINKLRKRD